MKPPAVARAIIRVFSDPADGAFLLEDLAERYRDLARTEGLRAAKRWYWKQALSAAPWAFHLDGAFIRHRSWAGVAGDLRFGFRTLRRNPIYAFGVAGTLGLGLAAAIITFAVAWRVWLAPMPYPDPDRVVRLYEVEPAGPETGRSEESRRRLLSLTLLGDLNAHSWRTIEAVSAVLRGGEEEFWIQDGEARNISRLALFPNAFRMLGIVPVLGRLPSHQASEILLTEPFWRTAFGGDPNVIGSDMDLGWGVPRIVGVARLPSGYPGDADIVMATDWGGAEAEHRESRYVEAIARLRPEYTIDEAKAELNAFLASLAEVHPVHRRWGMDAVVLADDLVGPFRGALALLVAAGVTFLLLAAVNVLGLVAARRVQGRHDRSIRLALGASEGRLLRGSLIESLFLAVVGSMTGVLSAYWLIGPIRALAPQDLPRVDDVTVTWPLVLSGLSIGIGLGVVIGVCGYLVSRGAKPSVGRAPVWRAVGAGGRRALVVGQVALTTLLIAGGVAILQRVSTLRAADLGYDPEGVSATSTVLIPPRYYASSELWLNAWHAVLDGLADRGIRAAMAVNTPMSEDLQPFPLRADVASEEVFSQIHAVSADYFSVMGIGLLAGRAFGPDDRASSQRVVIVSEEFVDRAFPASTPTERVIGRALVVPPYDTFGLSIVGVVRSTRHRGPALPVTPEVYFPFSQYARDRLPGGTLVVRGEPDEIAEAVSTVVGQVDPGIHWSPLVPYTAHLREWFAPFQFQIVMIGVLGALGLLLASLGLHALMAYQVASRRQELGIRKAVGATDGSLVWGVLASALTLALVGALVGLGAWYQLLPWTRELLDGIDSGGYVVPLTVALVVGGSCVLATLVPAVRASHVDPVVTLKAE